VPVKSVTNRIGDKCKLSKKLSQKQVLKTDTQNSITQAKKLYAEIQQLTTVTLDYDTVHSTTYGLP